MDRLIVVIPVVGNAAANLSEDAVAHVAWNAGARGHGIVQGFLG